MPPHSISLRVPKENATDLQETDTKLTTTKSQNLEILWPNAFVLTLMHFAAVYGLYICLFKALWLTDFYVYASYIFAALGVTAGAHRFWAHKSYKAKLPLQILLMCMNTVALEYDALHWVKIHRLHHKYSDTDADPHDARRGLFFSHIGWLIMKKHPEVKAKMKTINMNDIKDDPILNFQRRYYLIIAPLACFVIPTYIPTLWGETMWNSFFAACFRYIYVVNLSAMINSVAHRWGFKPYDKSIAPTDNKATSLFTFGEGFHNFHHTFPWDYRTGEISGYSFNLTKMFIEAMAAIGWAYDLKCVSNDLISKRAQKSGDGSYSN